MVLKMYGEMRIGNTLWVWDYAKEEPRVKDEMTKAEWAASEKAKYRKIRYENKGQTKGQFEGQNQSLNEKG